MPEIIFLAFLEQFNMLFYLLIIITLEKLWLDYDFHPNERKLKTRHLVFFLIHTRCEGFLFMLIEAMIYFKSQKCGRSHHVSHWLLLLYKDQIDFPLIDR